MIKLSITKIVSPFVVSSSFVSIFAKKIRHIIIVNNTLPYEVFTLLC